MTGAVLQRYFEACSSGSIAEVSACFTRDAVIYDTNHSPVVGRDAICRFWEHIRAKWSGARWEVHTVTADGARAAAEWSMYGTAHGEPFVVRGSEHYDFEAGLISQIRQYWTFDSVAPGSELVGFPYDSDERFRGE